MKNAKSTALGLLVMASVMLFGSMPLVFADELVTITHADQAVRIIRGVTLFKGAAGVLLQKNDIVETGASAAQIELANELILAVAADTKIYLVNTQLSDTNPPEIILLSGWIKVFNKRAGADGRVLITTPFMRATLENGSNVLHAASDKTEIFAESGVQTIAEISDIREVGAEIKIALEQYAFRLPGQAIKIIPRPPKQFITDMPMTFRDPLTKAPDRLKGAKIQPTPERDVNYPDVQPWFNSNIAVRKSFVKRFKPRLKDKDFRALLDAELGQTVDWKPILHPPPPPPKPKILK